MLLHRKNYQRLDLTNRVRGERALSALGFACTNANPGWYYDGSVYRQAAVNTCRYDSSGGRTGLLVEEADTNEVLYSSENNAVWTVSNATKTATGTSAISGKTPIKVTATGASGYIQQSVATLGNGSEYHYVIIEEGDGTVADLECNTVSRIRLTFATGAVTQVSGASTYKGAYKVDVTGPNGGDLWILYHSIFTVATPAVIRFYPDPTGSSKYAYLHHCQGSFSDVHGTSPIVTQGSPVSRDGDVITSSTIPSWWNDSACTVISKIEKIFDVAEQGTIFASSDGTANNFFLIGNDSSIPNSCLINVGVGGVVYSEAAGSMPSGSINKAAATQSNGATYAAANGTVSANANQVGAPAAATRFDIGQALGAVYFLNGRIFSLVIRPSAMSTTEIDAYTT